MKKTVITQVVLGLAIFFCTVAGQGCEGGEVKFSGSGAVSYSQIKEAIEASYGERGNLLKNSTGSADMFLEVTRSWLINEEQRVRGTKKAAWSTKWYTKGDKNRYDITIGDQEDNELYGKPLLEPEVIRAIGYPDRRICYKVKRNEVVIDKHLRPAGNPLGLSQCFDNKRLYQFNARYDVPALLKAWEKAGQPEISEEKVGEIGCIKMVFDSKKPDSDRRKRLEVWLAPSQAYSLIKARFLSNSGMENKELRLLEGYDATYEKAKDFKGVWLLKQVTITDNQIPNPGGERWKEGDGEKLTVVFDSIKVGVDNQEEVFSLKDLGIPKGTKIYDKRVRKVIGTYDGGFIQED